MLSKINKFNIGLSGGIGSGKSLVADCFSELGIDIIDADQITRKLMQVGQPAYLDIVGYFGQEILHTDKSLNRQHLRKLIFHDQQKKSWLESLIHPLVRERMTLEANKSRSAYVISMIPLLIETLPNASIDRILIVLANEETRIQRIIQRDHCTRELAKAIIDSQVCDNTRKQHADDIIENDNDITHVKRQVHELHQYYLTQSG